MCRTVNGLDANALSNFKENIQHVINGDISKIDTVFSGSIKDGRGNICPVTIILPTLAMEAGGNKDKFMTLLDKKIHEAKDMLIERFNYICSQSPASAKFMYENGTMAGYKPEEGIRSALKHGTLVIGQLGLAEALEIVIGTDQTTPEGMAFAKEVEALFNKRCAEFKKALSLNFGVYYTPAESLCYTAFKKWREKYGDRENVTYYIDKDGNRHDKLYFTNSIHVPVYKEMSPFKKIDIESELTPYSNAGCITYAEVLHDAIHNTEALEELVHYAMAKDIPYFAINSSNDLCESCGYQGAITDRCPKCGSENVSRLKRVTGYLTGSYRDAFNPGKIVETDQRVVHKDTADFTKKQ